MRMDTDLRKRLRASYDNKAWEREAGSLQDWKKEERNSFLALLRQEQRRSLLEIGAGTGRDAKFFLEQGLQVVCSDLSTEMVRLCQQKGLAALVMDCARLGFPANSFEAVYALNCLLHVPKNEFPAVLHETKRVLVPSGLFYLGVYGGSDFAGIWEDDSYEPKRYFSFYTDDQLLEVVSQTFAVHSFKRIPVEGKGAGLQLHFQSVILSK